MTTKTTIDTITDEQIARLSTKASSRRSDHDTYQAGADHHAFDFGFGDDSGSGSGDGTYGNGFGNDYGHGFGHGYSYVDGFGYSAGHGYGYGDGDGFGDGCGDGDGGESTKKINLALACGVGASRGPVHGRCRVGADQKITMPPWRPTGEGATTVSGPGPRGHRRSGRPEPELLRVRVSSCMKINLAPALWRAKIG